MKTSEKVAAVLRKYPKCSFCDNISTGTVIAKQYPICENCAHGEQFYFKSYISYHENKRN